MYTVFLQISSLWGGESRPICGHPANGTEMRQNIPIDENEFFKNAALKIGGSLNLKETLHDCLPYVRVVVQT
jgi:hypothetical protein